MDTFVKNGFRGIVELIDHTLSEMGAAGQLRNVASPEAIRAALLGLAEGALRDRLLMERAGNPNGVSVADIGILTDALVGTITTQTHTAS